MISASEIDLLLLSFCDNTYWRKVAMVIGKTQYTLEGRGIQITHEEIGTRLEHLVGIGRLESQGNIQNWRHSEVRLPTVSR